MPNDTVVIDDVRIKTLPDGRELFIVKDQAGTEYSTMKRELAEKARTWKGGPAMLSFDIKEKPGQSGQMFTNRYLNDVQAAQTSNGGGFTIEAPHDSKREDIARAVALKAAIDLASNGMLDTATPTAITTVADFFFTYLIEGHQQMVEDDIPF